MLPQGLRLLDTTASPPLGRPERLGELEGLGSSREVEDELLVLLIDLPLYCDLTPMLLEGLVRVSHFR